ncbi:MAG: CDP-glycerol glycerophosphotransferase family protein [Longicatena caecimuris]|uniref:CDP-glycerol glycerophosphotransferase family protein n=1 Tax=Longicatena caecimuris TaxID=1796635 RepID=UPI003994E9F4
MNLRYIKKPIIFYAFDKDYYQLRRGVHRSLDDACGKVCTTFDEVLSTIRNKTFEMEKLAAFIEECFDTHEKRSSDIVIDSILLHEKGKRC